MSTKTRLTAEEFWRLGSSDVRQELVNGEIVTMAPAGGVHGKWILRLGRRLLDHVDRSGGGEVVGGDVGFVLELSADRERVRAPDVAYISRERLPGGKLPIQFVRAAPDLAIEILSPSESPTEIQQKVREFGTTRTASTRLTAIPSMSWRSGTQDVAKVRRSSRLDARPNIRCSRRAARVVARRFEMMQDRAGRPTA